MGNSVIADLRNANILELAAARQSVFLMGFSVYNDRLMGFS